MMHWKRLLTAALSEGHNGIGLAGEMIVSLMLEKNGYTILETHELHCGDLKVADFDGEVFRVEVKTARKCKDGKYRFTLYKAGCTDHANVDFVVLLCALKSGDCVPFVVPISALRNQRQAVICSFPIDYAGKLAKYRQKLDYLTLHVVEWETV